MITFIPFEPRHMAMVDTLPEKLPARQFMLKVVSTPGALGIGPAFTGMDGNRVLGCAGLGIPAAMPHRASAWAWFGASIPRSAWVPIVSKIRQVMSSSLASGTRRIEMTVVATFENGNRLAHALGFEREGLLRCYDANGADHFIYSRINERHEGALGTSQPTA